MVGGVEDADHASVRSIPVSPDGKHIAHVAKKVGKWVAVPDDEEGPEHGQIIGNGPTFRDDDTTEYLALRQGMLYRVVHRPARQRGDRARGQSRDQAVAYVVIGTHAHAGV